MMGELPAFLRGVILLGVMSGFSAVGIQLFSCGFETDYCGMIQSTNDHFDWERHSGGSDTRGTGPSWASNGTFYIYIDATEAPTGYVAEVETGMLQHSGTVCVTFAYPMYGIGVGELSVRSKPGDTTHWRVSNDQTNHWRLGTAEVELRQGDRVAFRVVRTSDSHGDVALDDIVIRTGGCRATQPLPFSCSFEEDFCGMLQSDDDQFDWTRFYRPTGIGPREAADDTWIIYIETDFPRLSGDVAKIETPALDFRGPICVRFKYYSNGTNVGSLYVQVVNAGTKRSIFSVTGDQGSEWQTAEINVTEIHSGDWLLFAGERGLEPRAIGVDNVLISPGLCNDTASETTLDTIISATAVGAAVILIIIIVVSVVTVRRRRKRKQREPGSHIYVSNSPGIYDNDEHVSRDPVPYVDAEDGLLVAIAAPLVAEEEQTHNHSEAMLQAHNTSRKVKNGSNMGKPQEAEVGPNVESSEGRGEDPAAPVYAKVQKKKKTDVGATKPSLHQTARHSHQDIKDATAPQGSTGGDDANQCYNLPWTPGCTVAMFLNHVKQLRKNKGFALQFKNLPANKLYEWEDAERNGLKLKNRFRNILPYDKNRVRLDMEGDDLLSDYINASHIIGYDEADKFIASHGPIGATQRDFWRMICQEKVSLVVMGTKLLEGGKTKCTQYWPDEGETMAFGDITVHLETETRLADVTTRRLRVSRGSGEDRLVDHIQYTSWPDHGVPENAATLLSFHGRVRQLMRPGAPTLVHCSAGVGRTGTFIAFDHLLQQAERESTLDVVRCVTHLREQRINMVQTEKQYVFLHEALIEALLVRNTAVSCENFHRYLSESNDVIANHFKILEVMGPLYDKEDETTAMSEENKAKNGSHCIIPRTPKRVILTEHVDGRSDYVNAVYVNSHSKTNAYIATQIPLKDSRIDFLRMAHQTRCNLIVAIGLNIQDLLGVEVDVSRAQAIGDYHVTVEPPSCLGDIEIHKVCIDKINAAATYENLTMFKNREEEAGATPSHSCHVAHIPMTSPADLDVAKVTTLRSALEDHRTGAAPAIFVCRDGATCCGLTIAALNLLEATTLTNMADIFHVVKVIKNSRPEFIPTAERYRLLHHLIDKLIGGDEGM